MLFYLKTAVAVVFAISGNKGIICPVEEIEQALVQRHPRP